jgi:hypothetical protein
MFDLKNHAKKIKVISPTNLYKWNANYLKLQQGFFEEKFVWIREKQIRDFVRLNGYRRVYLMRDQNVLDDLADEMVSGADLADLVVVIDQRFSRVACPVLITRIRELLQQCPTLYLCLNRHYIDIDNSFTDTTLDADWQRAITQWLSRELAPSRVVDLSFYWDDRGDYLSWSIPDRHYLITT